MMAADTQPPMRTCPSAPMFQNRILNAGVRPMATQSRIRESRIVTQVRLVVPTAPEKIAL